MGIAKNIYLNKLDRKFLNDSMREPMLSRDEEKKLAEAESAKRLADALAAKLLVENSQLLKRVQELEAENA